MFAAERRHSNTVPEVEEEQEEGLEAGNEEGLDEGHKEEPEKGGR